MQFARKCKREDKDDGALPAFFLRVKEKSRSRVDPQFANCGSALPYTCFGAAVDGLEVRSASAACVDGKEIRPFVDWFVEDHFGKRHVGLHYTSARNLDVGSVTGGFVHPFLQL